MPIALFVTFIVTITWLISNYDLYLPYILKILKYKHKHSIKK